jgi:hypothetical protein
VRHPGNAGLDISEGSHISCARRGPVHGGAGVAQPKWSFACKWSAREKPEPVDAPSPSARIIFIHVMRIPIGNLSCDPTPSFRHLILGQTPRRSAIERKRRKTSGTHISKSQITSSAQRAGMAGCRFTMRRILSTRPLSGLAFWPRSPRPFGSPPAF